jgi:hypothetical protein
MNRRQCRVPKYVSTFQHIHFIGIGVGMSGIAMLANLGFASPAPFKEVGSNGAAGSIKGVTEGLTRENVGMRMVVRSTRCVRDHRGAPAIDSSNRALRCLPS